MRDPRTASTQYGDLEGESSADGHINIGLAGLARDLGIPGLAVGFSFTRYNSPNQREEDAAVDDVRLSVYVAERESGGSVDEINKRFQEEGETFYVNEYHTKIGLLKLLWYFKQFQVTFFNSHIKTDNVEVTRSIDLDELQEEE